MKYINELFWLYFSIIYYQIFKLWDTKGVIRIRNSKKDKQHNGKAKNYKKGALDSQPQVITFTSCLPMVGGSLRVLRLLPPLKLVAMM